MIKEDYIKLDQLLHALSSSTTYDILKLYSQNSYNLTETAKNLNLPVSTVQDNLKKLKEVDLVYSNAKKYYLSSFGGYFLPILENIGLFNKVRHIFGKIPADIIPLDAFDDLIPLLKNVEIEESSWHFMNVMNEHLEKFRDEIEEGKFIGEINVFGWWSAKLDFEVLHTYFPDLRMTEDSFSKFFKNVQIRVVSDINFADELIKNKEFKIMKKFFKIDNYIRIIEEPIKFNFTMMRFNNLLGIFLMKENDIDVKHHIFLETQEIHKFFNKVFNYYWDKSIPLNEFLKNQQ